MKAHQVNVTYERDSMLVSAFAEYAVAHMCGNIVWCMLIYFGYFQLMLKHNEMLMFAMI